MKSVDLTKDMRPWREGDTIHVPATLAKQLVKDGDAKNMRPFNPAGETSPADIERPKGTYQTKSTRTGQ